MNTEEHGMDGDQIAAASFLRGVLIIGGANLVTGIFVGWLIWG